MTYSNNPTKNRNAYSDWYDCTDAVQMVAIPHPTSSDGIT